MQSDDHTGAAQTYDINSLDFGVNGANRYSVDPTAEMLRIRKKWDTFEGGMQDYFEGMATILSGAEAVEGLYAL